MAEVLLRELSNADIDWMVTTGQRETIAAGTVLVKPCQDPSSLYVLLDGTLSVGMAPSGAGPAGATGRDGQADHPIVQLARGEIVGETALFRLCSMPAAIKAVDNSLVLSIPLQKLMAKLEQDIPFSAHFYRALALILAERLQRILSMPGQLQFTAEQPVKDALFIFGELRDSDIDWLSTVGQLEKLAPNKVLINAGRPVDALYLVLDGLLSISIPEGNSDPLALCFQGLERSSVAQKVVAYLSKGEMAGAISFLTSLPVLTTIRASQETLLLSISRQQLAAKLQQDLGFAARFHRIIAIQILNTLQTTLNDMGCNDRSFQQGLDEEIEYEDELCLTSLGQLSQGATKFNWMLKRLGIGY